MIKRSQGEKIYGVFNALVLIALAVVTLYPFWYVAVGSLSDPLELMRNPGLLLKPIGFTLNSYEKVLSNSSIRIGYMNTIIYAILGTLVNLVCTSMAAYALSRKELMLRNAVMTMITITMYVGGGLIPTYFLIQDLNLINSRWALILPGAISTYNMLILMRAFEGIPDSLEESARIDGAGEWVILFKILIPLIKPTLMVIMLYCVVGIWNSWFSAAIYIRDRGKYPLQIFLRDILTKSSMQAMTSSTDVEDIGMTIKYATIMVSTLPILFVYPFIQKHFVKGVLVGAVKG